MDFLFWIGGAIFCALLTVVLVQSLKQVIKTGGSRILVRIVACVVASVAVVAFIGGVSMSISHFLREVIVFL